jgi:hypothetical protein
MHESIGVLVIVGALGLQSSAQALFVLFMLVLVLVHPEAHLSKNT